MTSHAALTVSPRLSAMMPKATAPSAAMAIHKSFDWAPFRAVARLLIGVLLRLCQGAAARRRAAAGEIIAAEAHRSRRGVGQRNLMVAVPIVRRVAARRKPDERLQPCCDERLSGSASGGRGAARLAFDRWLAFDMGVAFGTQGAGPDVRRTGRRPTH